MPNLNDIMPDVSIIVMIDDPNFAKRVCSCIRYAGFKCEVAPNASKGLAMVGEDRPVLVIIDQAIAGVDGLEICRRIRGNLRVPFAYLIMLTANGGAGTLFQALEAGADDFLATPFDPDELVARIRAGHRVCAAHYAGIERAVLKHQADSLSSALDALEQAIAVMAHELRTPLTTLAATLELMLETPVQPDMALEQLQLIHHECSRLTRLVDGLMIAARCQAGCPVRSWGEVDLSQICRRTATLMEARLKTQKIRMSVQVPPTLKMLGSADGLEQIVMNLLSNAVVHGGGAIELRAREYRSPSGQQVEIKVSDHGRGMDYKALEQVRSALREKSTIIQAAHSMKGCFGLAICNALANVHGGHLSVDSELNRGTFITVQLNPLLKEPITTGGIAPALLAA